MLTVKSTMSPNCLVDQLKVMVFAKLASYDSNGDAVVDANDVDFSSLLNLEWW